MEYHLYPFAENALWAKQELDGPTQQAVLVEGQFLGWDPQEWASQWLSLEL